MKIAVTIHFGESYLPLAKLVLPPLKDYCYKHDYTLFINECPPNQKGDYTFIKTQKARELIEEFDLVFVIDCDTLITSSKKITDFIDDEHDFYICRDVNGVNAGSFIVKSSEWSMDFLDKINAKKDEYIDEQNVIEKFVDEKIKFLPHPSINSIPYEYYAPSYGYLAWEKMEVAPSLPTHEQGNWEVGDFLMHLPGLPLTQRLEIIQKTKNKLRYEL